MGIVSAVQAKGPGGQTQPTPPQLCASRPSDQAVIGEPADSVSSRSTAHGHSQPDRQIRAVTSDRRITHEIRI
jgi:hypothetical protein